MKFEELGLDTDILEAVQKAGFKEATPIQAQTIPLTLQGKDVIGQAQTGTGKTAAFGIPIIQNLDMNDDHIQALIISPTRELAVQTQEELYRLGRFKKAKVQVVYGGADIRRQIRNLKDHPQILVGTPGRLLDHVNRHTVKLDHIKTLVLDEADEMLDMGFVEDIESIIKNTPEDRQTLLFSATIPAAILKIGKKFMHNPDTVKIESKELTADLIDQYYVRSKEYEKFNLMTRLFDVQHPELTLVFGRTKRRVDELTRGLQARGYNAEGIHGDLSQQKRMSVLRSFKNGDLDILVATDVAARGLDISGVTHVYNYDIPQDPDSYVHRIGRTGRAGKSGVSVTFVTPNEMGYLRTIEHLTKVRMTPLKPPTAEEAFHGRLSAALGEVEKLVAADQTDALEDYTGAAKKLLAEHDSVELVAGLLKSMTKADSSTVPVKITPERPLPNRGRRGGNRNGGHGHGGRHYENHRGGRNNNHGRGGNRYDRDRRHNNRDNDHRSSDHRNGGGKNYIGKRNYTIRNNKD